MSDPPPEIVELSYCVVSTGRRELLGACLDAIAADAAALASDGVTSEVLVLDNATSDGSLEVAEAHAADARVLVGTGRRGKPENANELVEAAAGRWCLMLDDDAVLEAGAGAALLSALAADPGAAAAGAALRAPGGAPQPSAWRFPSVATALAGAVFAHRWFTVQSSPGPTRRVDWVQSAAMLVRRDAVLAVGGWDPRFFVYSDEVDLMRRLADAGRSTLFVPAATAVHHEQLAGEDAAARRIVEFSRNRDAYMRLHHSAVAAAAVRVLTAWAYLLRTAAALVLPGHSPRRYWRHVVSSLAPARGVGLREASAAISDRARASS